MSDTTTTTNNAVTERLMYVANLFKNENIGFAKRLNQAIEAKDFDALRNIVDKMNDLLKSSEQFPLMPWIKISDTLPHTNQFVIVINIEIQKQQPDTPIMAVCRFNGKEFTDHSGEMLTKDLITHWTPAPFIPYDVTE